MPLLSFKPHCTFPLPQVLQKMRQGVEFQNLAPGGYLVCVFGWEGALSYSPGPALRQDCGTGTGSLRSPGSAHTGISSLTHQLSPPGA